MSTSLYRKYRPSKFSELVGQDHVSLALQNAISEDRLSHAYLFSGTRGTGKTSTARILGTVLNCEVFKEGFPKDAKAIEPCGVCESCLNARKGSSFDVIELDAASNNGVEDMRELIEKVSYTSAAGGQKVYIIDEVHELTGRAANTLLKTLEEPPSHVVFILATTNPEKVLPTIRSRTQHFEFKSVDDRTLFDHVKNILDLESRQLDDDAIDYVVRKGAGSVRDTLSFLDQILAQDVTSFEDISAANGSLSDGVVADLLLACATKDTAGVFGCLEELVSKGKEPRAVVESIISYARDCLVLSLNPETKILLSGSIAKDELKNLGEKCGSEFLTRFITRMGKAVADMRGTASLNPLLTLEIALLDVGTGDVALVDRAASPQRELRGHDQPAAPTASARPAPTAPRKQEDASDTGNTTSAPGLREGRPKITVPRPKVEEPVVATEKPATLGALKKQAPTPTLAAAKEIDLTKEEAPKPAKKVTLSDVNASWPKVIMLLSPASQSAIKKAEPIKLDNDVLTFGVLPDDIEEVKQRFKKDASIIRGFLESLHENTFRFQIIPTESAERNYSQEADEHIGEPPMSDEKEMEEAEEYNPVDHILNKFGGEIVPE